MFVNFGLVVVGSIVLIVLFISLPVVRKIILAFFLAIIVCAFFTFSNPERIIVKDNGNIIGVINKIRKGFQGKDFWERQLNLINKDYSENLKPGKPYSEIMREVDNNLNKELLKYFKESLILEDSMEFLLNKKADSLKKEAKYHRVDRIIENGRVRRLEIDKILIPIIQNRMVKSYPPIGRKILGYLILLMSISIIIELASMKIRSNKKLAELRRK
jgi:hypothetical protein